MAATDALAQAACSITLQIRRSTLPTAHDVDHDARGDDCKQ
jgi:hypothetical protein